MNRALKKEQPAGHTVVVTDPNRHGWYRAPHRTSAAQRQSGSRLGTAATSPWPGQVNSAVLIQAAWVCWRHGGRGTRLRRLSRLLFGLWRDGTTFDVTKLAAA
jgi:hypothetical protein